MRCTVYAAAIAALFAGRLAAAQTVPSCSDPAVKGQVIRYLTGQTPPPETSKYLLASTLTNKWELGKSFLFGITPQPVAAVSIPTMHEGHVEVSFVRNSGGRGMATLICEYRRPTSVSDWSKVTLSMIRTSNATVLRYASGPRPVPAPVKLVDIESDWSDSRVFVAVVVPDSAWGSETGYLKVAPVDVPKVTPPPPPPPNSGSLNAQVMARALQHEGGRYCWVRKKEGAIVAIGQCPPDIVGGPSQWLGISKDITVTTSSGQAVWNKDPNGGTYCSGFTFMVASEVLEANKLFTRLSTKEAHLFRAVWYAGVDTDVVHAGKTLRLADAIERQSAAALELFGLGYPVPFDQAQPGDFVQMGTSKGGHSAIFLKWITDASGKKLGLEYRGSQERTGVANTAKCFSDSASSPECGGRDANGNRMRTYFSRLASGKR